MPWKTITIADLRKVIDGLPGDTPVACVSDNNETPITCITRDKTGSKILRLCENNKEISVGERVLLDLMEGEVDRLDRSPLTPAMPADGGNKP